jgi:hypothetical protein
MLMSRSWENKILSLGTYSSNYRESMNYTEFERAADILAESIAQHDAIPLA